MSTIDPNDRATVLREAADCAYRIARRLDDQRHDQRAQGAWDVENALRAEARLAVEEPAAPVPSAPTERAAEDPLCVCGRPKGYHTGQPAAPGAPWHPYTIPTGRHERGCLVIGGPHDAALCRSLWDAPADRQERYAVAIHDAMEPDLSLVDEDPAVQAVVDRAAEAAMAVADAEHEALRLERNALRRQAEAKLSDQTAVRAAVLTAAAQHLYTALFPAVYNDLGQKAAEGVNRAVSELRRMADEAPQQS